MKKLLSIILVLMLALTLLTSCGNNEGQQPVSEGKEASGEDVYKRQVFTLSLAHSWMVL